MFCLESLINSIQTVGLLLPTHAIFSVLNSWNEKKKSYQQKIQHDCSVESKFGSTMFYLNELWVHELWFSGHSNSIQREVGESLFAQKMKIKTLFVCRKRIHGRFTTFAEFIICEFNFNSNNFGRLCKVMIELWVRYIYLPSRHIH